MEGEWTVVSYKKKKSTRKQTTTPAPIKEPDFFVDDDNTPVPEPIHYKCKKYEY
jgi:hypothetical protein